MVTTSRNIGCPTASRLSALLTAAIPQPQGDQPWPASNVVSPDTPSTRKSTRPPRAFTGGARTRSASPSRRSRRPINTPTATASAASVPSGRSGSSASTPRCGLLGSTTADLSTAWARPGSWSIARSCPTSPSPSRRPFRPSSRRPRPPCRRPRKRFELGLHHRHARASGHPVARSTADDLKDLRATGSSAVADDDAPTFRIVMSDIATLEPQILRDISAASDEAALEAVRVAALGKSGSVSALLRTLGAMTPDERKSKGPLINGLKDRVTEALAARREALKSLALDQRLNTETVDVTLPLRDPPAEVGRIHPISQVIDELTAIFADMGFAVAEGPDIETDDLNFTKLNIPEGHPAREMHDTFFFNPKPDGSRLLLRTHTSPVQIRTMLSRKPPIRVIIPGRTYRVDSDQTHTPMFHQVEGLVIDKGSHLGHLKWILEEFCKAFFEVEQVKMRFRPSFFPFTEPSLEADIQCRKGKDEVRFGEGEDWMEILGCGMVHPNVLRNCGLDPDEYQGFAWGMGIDRIAMLKYGMPDLRPFFEADVRWLSHYGFRPLDLPTLAGGLS